MRRRLALLQIGLDQLVAFFSTGKHLYEIVEGVPKDAEVAGIGKPDDWWYSPEYHRLYVCLRSESFPEVPTGAVIPVLPLVLKQL